YLLGQLPSLLAHVQRHLVRGDPRRQEFERIMQRLGVKDPDHPLVENEAERELKEKIDFIAQRLGVDDPGYPSTGSDSGYKLQARTKMVGEERGKIVSIVRGASSAALREQLRVRSFRNVLVVTTAFMAILAIGVAL